MGKRIAIATALLVQIISAGLFFVNILSTITGVAQFPWMVHEMIELAAGTSLILGAAISGIVLYRMAQRTRKIEDQLRIASGAFTELMIERFDQWGLTPAERDVALFALKGLSTAEIAAVRQTSEGTVKAQTNAIYRKAGVSGRPQLMSLFIEELMSVEPAARVA